MTREADDRLQVGDIIAVAGVFRDGTMDETRQHETDTVQHWHVDAKNGGAMS